MVDYDTPTGPPPPEGFYDRAVRNKMTVDSKGGIFITVATVQGWAGQQPKGLVFCHGSGGSAGRSVDDPSINYLVNKLAQTTVLQTGDWALQAWGNQDAIDAVDEGVDDLLNNWGVQLPVAVVGASMGGTTALNYAFYHPTKVSCVVGLIGLTDLGAFYDRWSLIDSSVSAQIDTAYGGSFDEADRQAYSPVEFADRFPEDMPIGLWTSSNDPIVLPAYHASFIAKRPQTYQNVFGAYGHGGIAQSAETLVPWVLANS